MRRHCEALRGQQPPVDAPAADGVPQEALAPPVALPEEQEARSSEEEPPRSEREGATQAGEALKVYLEGSKAEPGNAACKNGIAEAKASIRQHQQRYEDYWGDRAKASGVQVGDEGAES